MGARTYEFLLNLWLVDGGELAAQFARSGLVDELWLSVIPVVLGTGAPVFGEAIQRRALSLSQLTQFGRGVVELRYRFDPPSTGQVSARG